MPAAVRSLIRGIEDRLDRLTRVARDRGVVTSASVIIGVAFLASALTHLLLTPPIQAELGGVLGGRSAEERDSEAEGWLPESLPFVGGVPAPDSPDPTPGGGPTASAAESSQRAAQSASATSGATGVSGEITQSGLIGSAVRPPTSASDDLLSPEGVDSVSSGGAPPTSYGSGTTSGSTVTSPSPSAPTPEPLPDPTPAPTPEPLPDPTPAPTPEPLPDPTPAPTPEPLPDPTPAPTPEPISECADGLDNDGDLLIDDLDPGCVLGGSESAF